MTDFEESRSIKANFHTHTPYCGHASGSAEAYCRVAAEAGMDTLGFSDHGAFPDNRTPDDRMRFRELLLYRRDIQSAAAKFPRLNVYTGLEIEYFDDLKSFYTDELLGNMGFDYLIGATHMVWSPDGNVHHFYFPCRETTAVLLEFAKQTIRTMENMPMLYMAHPDCFCNLTGRISPEMKSAFKDIADAAAELHIPLEINANGFRKGKRSLDGINRYPYPVAEFWEAVAENGRAEAVIGMDAHCPAQLTGDYDTCLAWAEKFGLNICNEKLARKLKGIAG